MNEMTLVKQVEDNHCSYACIRSILHDRGRTDVTTEELFVCGGELLALYEVLERRPKAFAEYGICVRKGEKSENGRDPTTAEILRANAGCDVIVVIKHSEDPERSPSWAKDGTHSLRIKASAEGVLIMDPWARGDADEAFNREPGRRGDGLLVRSTDVIDAMRTELRPGGTVLLEYFLIDALRA